MKLWINEVSKWSAEVDTQQSFFAIPVEVSDELGELLVRKHKEFITIQKYLRGYAHLTNASGQDPTTLEVPACLQEEARSESPPKKKATVATSKSKSQTKRKKTQSSTATSPPKEGSSG